MSSAGLEPEIGDFAETGTVTHGTDDIQVKEEEDEQEDGQEKRVRLETRRGKRKAWSMAKALRRHSIWKAGNGQPDHDESPTRALSKRQRNTSAAGTTGSRRVETHKTASRTTARYHGQGQRCCQEHGCTTRPSYGKAGSKKAEFCSQHAMPGMIHVFCKKCGHPGCMKHPSYGKAGSKKPEFCAQHAQKGMVDVVSKRCSHPGCTKVPSYGKSGSKKAEVCAQHSKAGMINVRKAASKRPGLVL
ncbi:unnamed protein product [Ectocarpus fasciculatus]